VDRAAQHFDGPPSERQVRFRPDRATSPRAPLLLAPVWERPSLAALDADGVPADGLAALLGRTRVKAIRAVAAGCTTTELARALDITPATASEHATVLRNMRLISTRRHRNAVLHTLTPLGARHCSMSTGTAYLGKALLRCRLCLHRRAGLRRILTSGGIKP